MASTPHDILKRLAALPPELAADRRRTVVEAISAEARAPLEAYYVAQEAATKATQAWAESHGAFGFYSPGGGFGGSASAPATVFAFKEEKAPSMPAWSKAHRTYTTKRGEVAMQLSRKPAGIALLAELKALPLFPTYSQALSYLGEPQNLNWKAEDGSRGGGGTGHSDGKMHFAVPVAIPQEGGGDRLFISFPNHNYDIRLKAESAIEYPEHFSPGRLDFEGDPIAWRPPKGWNMLLLTDLDLLIAEYNAYAARLKAERARSEITKEEA